MKTKRIVCIIISAIMVLSVTVAMCACSPRERGFYDLYDEYDNGNITYKEVKQIAIYYSMQTGSPIQEKVEPYYEYGNKKEWRTIEYDKNGKLPQLSEKELTEIEDAIYKNWEVDFINASISDNNDGASKEEQLEKYLEFEYCGKYHGKHAFTIFIKKGWGFIPEAVGAIIPDKIRYNSIKAVRRFFVYY